MEWVGNNRDPKVFVQTFSFPPHSFPELPLSNFSDPKEKVPLPSLGWKHSREPELGPRDQPTPWKPPNTPTSNLALRRSSRKIVEPPSSAGRNSPGNRHPDLLKSPGRSHRQRKMFPGDAQLPL